MPLLYCYFILKNERLVSVIIIYMTSLKFKRNVMVHSLAKTYLSNVKSLSPLGWCWSWLNISNSKSEVTSKNRKTIPQKKKKEAFPYWDTVLGNNVVLAHMSCITVWAVLLKVLCMTQMQGNILKHLMDWWWNVLFTLVHLSVICCVPK